MKRGILSVVAIVVIMALSFTAVADFSSIAKGSKGDAVKAIQSRLIELGFLSGAADGIFGNGTEKAVIAFQTEKGLDATGIVDEGTYNALYEGLEDLILFRGIKWYSTKQEAEKQLYSEGASSHGILGSDEDIYRMNATNYSNITVGSDRVDGGGYRGWYAGISVAGYDVDDTYACYVYPIQDDRIIHDNELAELYLGWYTFGNEYADHQAIYDDLTSKLTSVYGQGSVNSTKYNTTTTWKDIQGNYIRLLINDDKTYVTLGYMAADADNRLDVMAKALKDEQAIIEKEEREKNASDTSGL